MRPKPKRLRKQVARVVAGLVVLAGLEVLIYWTGGPKASPVYPLVYVWIAFLAGIIHPAAAVVTGLLAIAWEIALRRFLGPDAAPLPALVAHGGFMVLFTSLFSFLLIGQARHAKKTADDAVRDALERVEQDARDFRLIASSLRPETATIDDPEEAN